MNRLAEFAYQACSPTALRRCSDRTLVPSGFGGRHARFGISPSPSGGTHQACPDNPGYRHRSGADAAGRRTYGTCGLTCDRSPIQCEKTLGHPGWRPPIPGNAHQCNDRMRMSCERRDGPRQQSTIDDGLIYVGRLQSDSAVQALLEFAEQDRGYRPLSIPAGPL